jgi:hypothetical protein
MYPELERAARYFIGGVIALLVLMALVSYAAGQGENNTGRIDAGATTADRAAMLQAVAAVS